MLNNLINGIRWNLSKKKVAGFSEADFILVTLPKSGTTWLRVFLYSYFSGLENREFTMKKKEFANGKIPKFVITHDLFHHMTEPNLLARIRGRHLIPPRERRTKSILLMVRDPRDVMVSLYFELSKKSVRRRYVGEIGQMIEHPKFGIKMIVVIMNTWMRDWGGKPSFQLLRYENCRQHPEETFRGVLSFLGFEEVNESVLKQSLEFSSFENMKRMEAARKFNISGLSQADINDPESFRVRRGIIGGYRDYFDSEQIFTLEKAIALLDRRYGYN